jgi:hypothetical protein
MTAQSGADLGAAIPADRLDRPMAGLRQWTAGTLLGLLCCAVLLIGWRRLAGAAHLALRPVLLLSAGALATMAAVGIRLIARQLPAGSRSLRPYRPMPLVTTGAVLALGASLSLSGTDTWGLVAFWAMLAGEELWAWRPAMWRGPPTQRSSRAMPHPTQIDTAKQAVDRLPAAVTDDLPGEDVSQQLTRSRAADGSELLSGWLRTTFAAGQRTAIVHVAFCPQFAGVPHLTVQQLDGPEVLRINEAVFSFGARLDLKLAAAAEEPLAVLLRFSARSKPPTTNRL